jgi:histidine triad (HIT) family protein
MASVFTKIISGELPCYKIFEDELTFSFLALDQINLGHTLVIPKVEVNHWMDTPEKAYLQVAKNARLIGQAIRSATACPRVLTAAIGFEVPHYHMHLIPAWSMADLSFAKATRRTSEEMILVQNKIIEQLQHSK